MTPKTRYRLRLEPVEARLAPAVIFNYTDVDGDHVRITNSLPLTAANTAALAAAAAPNIVGGQLQLLDLTPALFTNTSTTIQVVAPFIPGKDRLANVGYINSTGHDLGNVTVRGDLGQIDAGDGIATTGLNILNVRSLGRLGTATQNSGASPNLESNIIGKLALLVVGTPTGGGDVKDAFVQVTGGPNGKIGGVLIYGSVIGGSAMNSGKITCNGDMGMVTVRGNVQGGSGIGSGVIQSDSAKLAGVHIFGSLIGGSNNDTGEIASSLAMGKVTIGGNVVGGSGLDSGLIISNDTLGVIGGVQIGGSLLGGNSDPTIFARGSGAIVSTGNMGLVSIGHDVVGSSGFGSGHIQSGNSPGTGNLAGVHIGGSLFGGSHVGTPISPVASGGILSFGNMGPVSIGYDVVGGTGFGGQIHSVGTLGNVQIGGSLIGGGSTVSGVSGEIFSIGDMGAVTIGQDFTGASITGMDSLDRSGYITSTTGRISGVSIGGSIISGIDNSSGALTRNASIRAANDIGFLYVGGSVIGNDVTGNGASPVVISARGQLTPSATSDLAIGPITVGGVVEFANFLAGYGISLNALNRDAGIGLVNVGGYWAASNLVAGVMNLGADGLAGGSGVNADNTNFGDGFDTPIPGGTVPIIAKIAGIKIGGQVFGTPSTVSATDHFGFVAERIVSLKIGGIFSLLTFLPDNLPVGQTSDMNAHEV